MELQRRLLRAMLWMLGLSAAAGVLAVFLSTRIMGRVAGTTLIAAFAIAAAIPVSKMLDNEKKRTGGLVGLCAIMLAFVAAMAAVWAGLLSVGWNWEDEFGFTALILWAGGLIAANLVPRLATPDLRWTARAALITDGIAVSLFLISVWMQSENRPAATACFLLPSGAAIALALVGLGIEQRPWRWLGVIASIVAFVLAFAGTWFVHSDDPTAYIIAMCLATVVAHAIVVLRVPLGDARLWTLLAAIGSTAATGVCISMLALITNGLNATGPDLLMRVTGALGIVAACSTLAVVVMYRLNRKQPGTSAVVSEITTIALTCPHCGRRGDAAIGESACAGCGLVISVSVREPRCINCDYSLLHLRGNNCPECGTAFADAGLAMK